ncbi:MAG: hypothetical protein AAFY54_04085 [Cyanobacteria bacterium J06648_10]
MSEARAFAESQLEAAIKDVLSDEFEACWNRIKDDPAITDPEEQMEELAEWFGEQVQATIEDIMESEDDDEEDDAFDDDDDDTEEEDEGPSFEEE